MSCCGGTTEPAKTTTGPTVVTNESTTKKSDQSKQTTGEIAMKLLILGDSGVGKTCLLLRFADDSYSDSFISTIGIDFKHRTIELDGRKIKLQIWDTAGQERYRTITAAYYRSAQGILMCYDVTDDKSFNNISNWVQNINQHASVQVNKVLIGNKCDSDKRQVSTEKGKTLAAEYAIPFFETSAKAGINVEDAFIELVRGVKKRLYDNT